METPGELSSILYWITSQPIEEVKVEEVVEVKSDQEIEIAENADFGNGF